MLATALDSAAQRQWTLKYILALIIIGIVHVFDRMVDADIITIILLITFFVYSFMSFFSNLFVYAKTRELQSACRLIVIAAIIASLIIFQPMLYFNYINIAIFDWYYDYELRKSDNIAESFGWSGGWDPIYLVHFRDPIVAHQMFDVDKNWQSALFPSFYSCSTSSLRLTPTYYAVQFTC